MGSYGLPVNKEPERETTPAPTAPTHMAPPTSSSLPTGNRFANNDESFTIRRPSLFNTGTRKSLLGGR